MSRVIEETPDARSFVLEIPPALRERYDYAAGQFITVEAPWGDFHIRRCYSLSSSPGLDSVPQFTVKRVANGRMSGWLLDRVTPKTTLRISLPEGRFVLRPKDASRPLTLFAAGSGITPVLSLLKAALHNTARPVALLYANRDAGSVIFREELDSLVVQFPERLSLRHHLDSESGILSDTALSEFVAAHREGTHYVCGPAPFMDRVQEALDAAEVAEEHRHFERFVSPVDPDRQPLDHVRPATDATGPSELVVRLEGRHHRVPLAPGQTLLEAAHAAGLRAPSSCESGYCGSCMAQRVEGDVRMRSREALTDREVERGRILLCQAVPCSDAPIEVNCDATSFRIDVGQAGAPLLRRVLTFAIAVFVITAVWVLRTRG